MDHDRCVPANDLTDAVLGGLVAGEDWLTIRGNGVDVVGTAKARHAHIEFRCTTKQLEHEVAGSAISFSRDNVV
jgi:hypothetical protein